MPFEPGIGSKIYENVGRKGYEIEQAQLEQMTGLLGKYLKVIDRILEDKESDRDIKKIQLLGNDVRAILGKLHATKTQTEHSGNLSINIEKEVAEKYNINANEPTNTST